MKMLIGFTPSLQRNMNILLIACLTVFLSYDSLGSGIQPDTVLFFKHGRNLPPIVQETSGLLFYQGLVWTHNDSGNKPVLYGFNPGNAKVKSRLKLKGVRNNDWEDIALTPYGVVVGDFGDNRGVRNTRELLRFEFPKKYKYCNAVVPTRTRFSITGDMFQDPSGNMHNRDIEAMTWAGNRLLLFTKNRKDHLTYILALDSFPADTVLSPIGVLQAGGLVTGADYHEESDMLVLVGYARFRSFVYILPDFLKSGMESDRGKRIILQGLDGSQVEGITWIGPDSVLISTEKTGVFGPVTYLLRVNHLAANPHLDSELLLKTTVFARQAIWSDNTKVDVLVHAREGVNARIEIISTHGEILASQNVTLHAGDSLLSVNHIQRPARGSVFVRITSGDDIWSTMIQDTQ